MDSFKWPSRTIEQFLRIYTKHPCLWDITHPKYGSQPERQLALESILAAMHIPGLNIDTLRRKIHSIRNTYTNERRKVERSKQATPNEVYKPRIRWYHMADLILGGIAETRKKIAAANNLLMTRVIRTRPVVIYQDVPHKPKERPAEVSVSTVENVGHPVRSTTERQCKPSDLADLVANFNGTCASSAEVAYIAETPSPSFLEVTCKDEPLETPEEPVEIPEETVEIQEEPVEVLGEDGIEEAIEEDLGARQHTAHSLLFQQPQGDELEAFSRSVLLQMRRLPEEYNIDLMSEIQRLISHKRREFLYSQAKYGMSQNSLSRRT